MALNRDDLKAVRQRRYLAKDFDSLRAQLLTYAQQYYPNALRDFSENSLGGLLLDMAGYIGDTTSFYLDHQYGELNADTAVETANIQRALVSAGVPISGATPAIVPVTIYVQIPAALTSNTLGPQVDAIPSVLANSIFRADNGTEFILLEDVDFNVKRSDGTYHAQIRVGNRSTTGTPTSYIMARHGLCMSGKLASESFALGSTFTPFQQITLSNANVTNIISANDGLGNMYYQVSALTNDVVYRNVLNTATDNNIVKDAMKVVPAPYRYIATTDLASRQTTLTMGGGSATTLQDDVIPDPSEFAISFPYAKTFARIPINPQQLLQTKTLGVAATNTTLTVNYSYGGGLNNNVPVNTIRTVKSLKIFFPGNPSAATAASIKGNVQLTNKVEGAGGEDAASVTDLKALIPSIRNSQERIVSREDLLARVYTLPANFGRVFRASIRSNPNNPLSTQLFIISRNTSQQLITSPDTLKQNLRTYLNPYRMISDAIDILDARIVNLSVSFEALIDPGLNRSTVLQAVLAKLQTYFAIANFVIDQPIVIKDVETTIQAIPGIISVNNLRFKNVVGPMVGNRAYSQEVYDISSNTANNIVFPPPGGIFEVRYPPYDIIARAAA